jgi:hypothetical protein
LARWFYWLAPHAAQPVTPQEAFERGPQALDWFNSPVARQGFKFQKVAWFHGPSAVWLFASLVLQQFKGLAAERVGYAEQANGETFGGATVAAFKLASQHLPRDVQPRRTVWRQCVAVGFQ